MPSFEILTYVVFGKNMTWEKFEDTKGLIRIRKSKDSQPNGKKKAHRKLQIEKPEPH